MTTTDDRMDRLQRGLASVYGGPLEEFVRRRDALVRELRSTGERESAAAVKSLRKPSRTAWALNLGALRSDEAADAVVEAVAGTIEAQAGGRDVRTAIGALRAAVREFAGKAALAVQEAGQHVDPGALAGALLAVLGKEESLEQLRAGRLTEIPEAGGLDFMAALAIPADPAPGTAHLPEVVAAPPPPKVRPVEREDRSEWLRLLLALYPGSTAADHTAGIEAFLAGSETDELVPSAVFVATRDGGGLAGCLELSVRNYAEGCAGATPYVESWFVDPDQQGRGVGRLLMRAAEDWARDHGYPEIASDTLLDNHKSQAAHRALGFEEVERSVHFRKSL